MQRMFLLFNWYEIDFNQTSVLCKGMVFCNETILHIQPKKKLSMKQHKTSRAALTIVF